MAFASIIFENPKTGLMKEAPVGFSWTVFFFGFIAPMFRGDWKWSFIILLCQFATLGLSNIFFMFKYNKLYIKDLVYSGYKAKSITKYDINFVSIQIGFKIPQLT
ncbi:hypothetical protein [Pigmentibacter ruber]|uniref:hypothetical protein n=1 Tax=Pigmentibacter ruber TaxID=2683196 RepID=UPI00131CAF42|nr:hypothetical protein [Pigmentibacter ruber]